MVAEELLLASLRPPMAEIDSRQPTAAFALGLSVLRNRR